VAVTGVAEVSARFRALPDYVRKQLVSGMNAIGYGLAATIVSTKLHGQVLHQRSGNLATAVAGGVETTDAATEVRTRVGVLRGPALAYAGIHEYGGDIHRVGSKKGAYVIHMPERSYLRSTLGEQRDAILGKISRVVAEAQRGG
jgi:phage gpG-like protein